MIVFPDNSSPKLVEILSSGGIGIVLTDTLYGVVAKADDEAAVTRVYELKGRSDAKPPIVLIADVSQLYDPLPVGVDETVDGKWPGKNSIIIPSLLAPKWLSRGSSGVAYRIPDNNVLRRLLRETGPLIAPSANPQGSPPARSIGEAEGYFGDRVDFYADGGVAFETKPSSLFIMTSNGDFEQLR
ncbi:L-threonylcarbamoyladenylate synthase [Candidatus Saccharibacteria bacterium]|nr:L-threonylcarbamoyladenylate synthase [Candidatus Saccharibacteria bacterium]